jgi:hypothetical protein
MAGSTTPKSEKADRRRAARVNEAQGETVLVWIEGRAPQAAIFLDESYYGIGVALQDYVPLQIGQRVEVVFRGTAQAGLVSSLRSYHDVLRVGLQWADIGEQPLG